MKKYYVKNKKYLPRRRVAMKEAKILLYEMNYSIYKTYRNIINNEIVLLRKENEEQCMNTQK